MLFGESISLLATHPCPSALQAYAFARRLQPKQHHDPTTKEEPASRVGRQMPKQSPTAHGTVQSGFALVSGELARAEDVNYTFLGC